MNKFRELDKKELLDVDGGIPAFVIPAAVKTAIKVGAKLAVKGGLAGAGWRVGEEIVEKVKSVF